jgi:predicted membrane-bound dolichyl-phosphate-mannose-protein mannosyltransferase
MPLLPVGAEYGIRTRIHQYHSACNQIAMLDLHKAYCIALQAPHRVQGNPLSEKHDQSELLQALQTAHTYERQVAALMLALRKADKDWERAEHVCLIFSAVYMLVLCNRTTITQRTICNPMAHVFA